jgi:hypothetical protein
LHAENDKLRQLIQRSARHQFACQPQQLTLDQLQFAPGELEQTIAANPAGYWGWHGLAWARGGQVGADNLESQ